MGCSWSAGSNSEWRNSLTRSFRRESSGELSKSVPLLFNREKASRKNLIRKSTLFMEFPMYLIPVPTLLSLEALEPHQVLKKRGLLQEWNEDLIGRAMFVSHEWLGFSHADPEGHQLFALQKMLRQLLDGSIDQVQSHDQQRSGAFKFNQVVTAEEWASALPYMFIWLDFICIPQVKGCDADADQANFKGELKCAVDSIPAYIQRCVLVVVLVPLCQHYDKGVSCTYGTWRSRGWCRLEFQIASLADSNIRVMVCPGSHCPPYFIKLSDTWKLLAGDGNFTCCQRGHVINGIEIECDKLNVSNIISSFLWAKRKEMHDEGLHQSTRLRHMLCLSEWLTHGIREVEMARTSFAYISYISGLDSVKCPLQMLKGRLCWGEEDEHVKEGGRTLLYYAALSNNTEATELLIQNGTTAGLNAVLKDPESEWGERAFTPLMAAMVFGTFCTVDVLLNARADPDPGIEIPGGNAFMLACSYGRAANIRAWLRKFPAWDLEWKTHFGVRTKGNTALMSTVQNAPDTGACEVAKVLLAARANVNAQNDVGNSVLECACTNDNAVIEVIKILLEARAMVNHMPDVAAKNSKIEASGHDLKYTALMHAIERSKIDEVRALLDARADLTMCNSDGLNALNIASNLYGKEIPRVLQRAFDDAQQSKANNDLPVAPKRSSKLSVSPKHDTKLVVSPKHATKLSL